MTEKIRPDHLRRTAYQPVEKVEESGVDLSDGVS